jgi:hypothetical protein
MVVLHGNGQHETDRQFGELRGIVMAKWCGKFWDFASRKRGKINNEKNKEFLYTFYKHKVEKKRILEFCVI